MRYIFECDNEAELLELRDRLNALYPKTAEFDPKLDKKLDFEDFTVRTLNALRADDIDTYRLLLSRSRRDILGLPNLGRKAFNEIESRLQSLGFQPLQ